MTPGTDACGRGPAVYPTFDSGSVFKHLILFWADAVLWVSGTKQKRVCVQAIFVHAPLVRSNAPEKPPVWHTGAKNSWIISFRSVRGSWLRGTCSGGARRTTTDALHNLNIFIILENGDFHERFWLSILHLRKHHFSTKQQIQIKQYKWSCHLMNSKKNEILITLYNNCTP